MPVLLPMFMYRGGRTFQGSRVFSPARVSTATRTAAPLSRVGFVPPSPMSSEACYRSCRQTDQELELTFHSHGAGDDIMKFLHCPRTGLLIAGDRCLD